MATLTGDIRVWSLREDVVVRDADFSAVRYQDKSSVSKERVYYEEKKRYIEARGGCVVPKNSRPARLRDAIKEFEELISSDRVVWSGWYQHQRTATGISPNVADEEPCRVYQMVLSSGVVCSAVVSAVTGDLRWVSSDKYLTGKLLSEHPAHAVITPTHLLISYNDSRLTVLHMDAYTPPSSLPLHTTSTTASASDTSGGAGGGSAGGGGGPVFPAIASRHPSLYTAQLAGPHGRRFQRKLSANTTGEMVVVWWERTEDEVYPWSPIERDRRDRANMLVYRLNCGQLSLLCHARSHLPPLSVAFSCRDSNVLLSVEQGFDKRGGVTVLSCVYKVSEAGLERVSVTSIPLEAPVSSHSHSPREDRLVLACNNGVVALHSHASTHLTRAALCPARVTWLEPGALVAVANDRGQVQCFDMALSLVRIQLGGDDAGQPVRLLDLADYFCHQPALSSLSWAPAPVVISGGRMEGAAEEETAEGCEDQYRDLTEQYSSLLLLLHYSRGPLTCLRFNAPHFSLTYPIVDFRSNEEEAFNDSQVNSKSEGTGGDPHNTSQISCGTTVSNTSSNLTKSSQGNTSSSNNNTSSSSTDVTSSDVTNNNSTKTSGDSPRARGPRDHQSLHYCSISPDVLVGEYLVYGQVEEAINLCGSLCWEQDGGVALKCISSVVNYIIRRGQLGKGAPLSKPSADYPDGERLNNNSTSNILHHSAGGSYSGFPVDTATETGEVTVQATDEGVADRGAPPVAMETAGLGVWEQRVLGAAGVLASGFLSPATPLSTATEELYGPPVRALARRLFFKLLRSGCLQSSLSLARDLGDPDCFLRLHRAAQHATCPTLAADALRRAQALRRRRRRRRHSSGSSSCCSRSSCSHEHGSSSGSWTGSSRSGKEDGDGTSSSSGSSSSSCCSGSCCDDHDGCSSGSGSSYTGSSCSGDTCSTCSATSSGSGTEQEEDEEEREQGKRGGGERREQLSPMQGERQGGDGRESEGNSSTGRYLLQTAAGAAGDDTSMTRLSRPLYTQQPTGEPPPVPAPVLPPSVTTAQHQTSSSTDGGSSASHRPQQHSTMTYYDPVTSNAPSMPVTSGRFDARDDANRGGSSSSRLISKGSSPIAAEGRAPDNSSFRQVNSVPKMFSSEQTSDVSSEAYEPVIFNSNRSQGPRGELLLSTSSQVSAGLSMISQYSRDQEPLSSVERFVSNQYNDPRSNRGISEKYASQTSASFPSHSATSASSLIVPPPPPPQSDSSLFQPSGAVFSRSTSHNTDPGTNSQELQSDSHGAVDPSSFSRSSVTAITSQDGKVTINITQDSRDSTTNHHHRHHHRSSGRHSAGHKDSAGKTRPLAEDAPAWSSSPVRNDEVKHHAAIKGKHHQSSRLVEASPSTFAGQQGGGNVVTSHDEAKQPRTHGDNGGPVKKTRGGAAAAPSSGAFSNRRSQRNMADAMDAADSAMAAIHSSKGSGRHTSRHKHSSSHAKHKPMVEEIAEESSASGYEEEEETDDVEIASAAASSSEKKLTLTPGSSNLAKQHDRSSRVSHSSRHRAALMHDSLPGHQEQFVTHDGTTATTGVMQDSSSQVPLPHYTSTAYQAAGRGYPTPQGSAEDELNRSIYQELSTEEEEGGGTVKVVHFGVV